MRVVFYCTYILAKCVTQSNAAPSIPALRSLRQGDASVLLPIIHYALLEYSSDVANALAALLLSGTATGPDGVLERLRACDDESFTRELFVIAPALRIRTMLTPALFLSGDSHTPQLVEQKLALVIALTRAVLTLARELELGAAHAASAPNDTTLHSYWSLDVGRIDGSAVEAGGAFPAATMPNASDESDGGHNALSTARTSASSLPPPPPPLGRGSGDSDADLRQLLLLQHEIESVLDTTGIVQRSFSNNNTGHSAADGLVRGAKHSEDEDNTVSAARRVLAPRMARLGIDVSAIDVARGGGSAAAAADGSESADDIVGRVLASRIQELRASTAARRQHLSPVALRVGGRGNRAGAAAAGLPSASSNAVDDDAAVAAAEADAKQRARPAGVEADGKKGERPAGAEVAGREGDRPAAATAEESAALALEVDGDAQDDVAPRGAAPPTPVEVRNGGAAALMVSPQMATEVGAPAAVTPASSDASHRRAFGRSLSVPRLPVTRPSSPPYATASRDAATRLASATRARIERDLPRNSAWPRAAATPSLGAATTESRPIGARSRSTSLKASPLVPPTSDSRRHSIANIANAGTVDAAVAAGDNGTNGAVPSAMDVASDIVMSDSAHDAVEQRMKQRMPYSPVVPPIVSDIFRVVPRSALPIHRRHSKSVARDGAARRRNSSGGDVDGLYVTTTDRSVQGATRVPQRAPSASHTFLGAALRVAAAAADNEAATLAARRETTNLGSASGQAATSLTPHRRRSLTATPSLGDKWQWPSPTTADVAARARTPSQGQERAPSTQARSNGPPTTTIESLAARLIGAINTLEARLDAAGDAGRPNAEHRRAISDARMAAVEAAASIPSQAEAIQHSTRTPPRDRNEQRPPRTAPVQHTAGIPVPEQRHALPLHALVSDDTAAFIARLRSRAAETDALVARAVRSLGIAGSNARFAAQAAPRRSGYGDA